MATRDTTNVLFLRGVSPDERERLKRIAHGRGLSLAAYIRRLVTMHQTLLQYEENWEELAKHGLGPEEMNHGLGA